MNGPPAPGDNQQPHLLRRFGLLQAIPKMLSNLFGIAPFITIPALMSTISGGGPQCMLGWIVALMIALRGGLIWAELGAAMPGSGGSYVFLREGFGRETWGRLMAFLFIWQFILSGPLEIASGYIGFTQYAGYILPSLGRTVLGSITLGQVVTAAVGLLNILLLYRRITAIGRITVALWAGVLLTVAAVVVTGAMHFEAKRAFDFPPHAFDFSIGYLFGMGAAARIGIYDYLGYYDVCYIGDEVQNPGRVIPRSILVSTIAVALIYIGINFSIIGVVPWRRVVPAREHPRAELDVFVVMRKIF